MTLTIQDIFEMRKRKQYEEAYQAVLPMYELHHGHYTTSCMFWTASDIMRLRIEAGKVAEAEQIMASLRQLYPNMQDKDYIAARAMNRLALQLATKEQEITKEQQYQGIRYANWGKEDGAKLSWEIMPDPMTFSLLDYMVDFGVNYLSEEDWQMSEWNGHPVPSRGSKMISRIYHEVSTDKECSTDRLEAALEFVQMGLDHVPTNKHMLRYRANLLYRLGEKQQAIAIYRMLTERSRDAYLFSELAGMIDDHSERAALLSKAITSQRMEVFAQRDRLTLAELLKEYFPQNAAYELQQVAQLRDSLGQRYNRAMLGLQKELENVSPVSAADQQEFYQRLMKEQRMCA